MFSCNVVSRWAQLVSFLNCLQDVKLSRIAIYRDEFRRMNCSLNWSFISSGELHCDSAKIKTMINSSLFFLRQSESLDWSSELEQLFGCFVIAGYSFPTHCFSFSQCFRAGVFSSFSPPPPRSLWLAPSPPLFGKFQHVAFGSKLRAQRKRLHCRLNYRPSSSLTH